MSKKSLKSSTVHEIIEEMQEYADKLKKNLKGLRENEVTHPNHIKIKKENIKTLEKKLEEIERSLKKLENLSWVKKK